MKAGSRQDDPFSSRGWYESIGLRSTDAADGVLHTESATTRAILARSVATPELTASYSTATGTTSRSARTRSPTPRRGHRRGVASRRAAARRRVRGADHRQPRDGAARVVYGTSQRRLDREPPGRRLRRGRMSRRWEGLRPTRYGELPAACARLNHVQITCSASRGGGDDGDRDLVHAARRLDRSRGRSSPAADP